MKTFMARGIDDNKVRSGTLPFAFRYSTSTTRPHSLATAVLMIAMLVVNVSAFAQSGNGYDLTWSTIDSGGEMFSTGNSYELGGTIGQADAGVLMGAGGYELTGGFWGAAVETGAPCANVAECKDDAPNNACNHAACTGSCSYSCVKYGDVQVPPNGIVNLDDILCLLAGFGNFANCVNGDVHPCGGNGIINLDDILGVLAAFGGANPCGCNAAGTAPLCGSVSP